MKKLTWIIVFLFLVALLVALYFSFSERSRLQKENQALTLKTEHPIRDWFRDVLTK